MHLDNIKRVYDRFSKDGWTDEPYKDIVAPFGWTCWGGDHVRKGDELRFTQDAILEELDIELHHYHELVGSYTHTGDILGVLERWLTGE